MAALARSGTASGSWPTRSTRRSSAARARRLVPYLSRARARSAGSSPMSASKGVEPGRAQGGAWPSPGPSAAADLARLPEEVGHGPSHVGVIAHTAALRDGGVWLDALLGGLDDNRRLLAALLAEHLPAVRHEPSQATYLAWLDCRALDLDGDPADVFLERGRVALTSGIPFGTGGSGFVRLNLATSPELITEGMSRVNG
ncbi:cysteine-S-conjugate beta-lyase OS=Streptomyces violarus OX=67380 GN=FHS41_000327 PE=3 SV=1 [Streptomyces violarus]